MKPPQTPEETAQEWALFALWFGLISAFITAVCIAAMLLETQLRP